MNLSALFLCRLRRNRRKVYENEKKCTDFCHKTVGTALYLSETPPGRGEKRKGTTHISMRLQEHHTSVDTPRDPLPSAFERLGRSLHRMARSVMGDADEADDALQEAFCRLWPRRSRIRTEEEAARLLTATVRNLSIDVLRRRQVESTVPLDEARDATPDGEAEMLERREEQYRRVCALVEQKLTPLQRDILHRREILGQGYEEIARDLQMLQPAVRTQLSRARKTIRECYKNEQQ